jgi:hypothetical protein
MLLLFIESSIIGFISWIIGSIIFNLSINKKNKDRKKPYGIDFAFFSTGLLLNIILELVGFNKWYCDKKIMCGLRNFSKL